MHISILMLARQNEINLNRGRVKWVVRAAEGEGGKKREKEKKPQFMPLCRTSKCFSIISDSFRHLSPAAGSGSCFSARWTTPTAKPKLQMKPRASQVDGEGRQEGAGRTILLAKQKGPHFLTWTICQIATTIAALRLGQEKSEGKEGRMGAVLFHIKVNEFTTSNCGAKLIEKVYSASRKAIPFSTC